MYVHGVCVLRGHSCARRMRTRARKGEKASARTAGCTELNHTDHTEHRDVALQTGRGRWSKARSSASLIYHGIDGRKRARDRTGMQNQAHTSTTTTGERPRMSPDTLRAEICGPRAYMISAAVRGRGRRRGSVSSSQALALFASNLKLRPLNSACAALVPKKSLHNHYSTFHHHDRSSTPTTN